jgi:predicted AlkP superfamily phosphohydrolase/phosphomutase
MTTIAIGLDGANWEMLGGWLDEGRLPNLAELIETGIGGTSESVLPPLTVPNWKCYATGKNPGKLDVFRFDRIDTENREHVFHDATDFKSPELWDYLTDEGQTAGVVNKPSTYPPKEIDGFVVAGGPDASEREYRSLSEGFASPPEIEEFLVEELDYRVHPSPMISPTETGEAEIEAILDLIDLRFEAAEALLDREDPDFLHLTVFYSMALQHYFFREEPVRRAWERIDEWLGRFADRGDDLLILSDHGTWQVETVFYVNVWLEQEGYLVTERSVDHWLRRAGVTRERALAVAKRLGITEALSAVVPERIQKLLPWEEGLKRERVLAAVDWEETTAIASNQGPVYLAVEDPDERARLREELIEKLSTVTHPETGDPLIADAHRGDHYYYGPYTDNAPDILLDQGENVHVSDAIGPSSWYSASGVWEGGNMPDGIFLFSGPSFREEGLSQSARIVDLAPTLLHAMGLPVPEDMDGRVLDVFDSASPPGQNPVQRRTPLDADREDSGTDGEDVEQRLVDLGYLE